jgi:hypothetical protein
MKSKIFLSVFILFCGLLCFTTGCTPEGTGTLTINLTDAPGDYDEVFITFSQISVHRGEEQAEEEQPKNEEDDDGEDNDDGSWIIISEDEQGFNLLDYKNQDKMFDILATGNLDEGIYTQIRLKIVEGMEKTYVTLEEGGEKYPLEVPSGTKSGLKLTHPFRIDADNDTILYLDFDAGKSVNKTGNGEYKLKPTIAVISNLSPKQGIRGIVQASATEGGEATAMANTEVFAYTDSGNTNEDEGKLPEGSITTEADGTFALPLPAETHTLEVIAEGYDTATIDSIIIEEDIWTELEEPILLNPTIP